MTLLWGSHFDTQAQQNLRQAISRLRRVLGDQVLVTTDHLVSINTQTIECDLERFESLARDRSLEALAAAAAMFDGALLSDVSISEESWGEWVRVERSRVEKLALDALVSLGEAELDAQQPERALVAGNKAVAIDPLREDAHRIIIRALMATGRRAEAVRQYEQLTTILKKALDVAPDPSTQELVFEVRAAQRELHSGDRSSEPSHFIVPAETSDPVQQHVNKDVPAILFISLGDALSNRTHVEQICRRVLRKDFGARLVPSGEEGLAFQFPDSRSGAAAAFHIQTEIANSGISAAGNRPPGSMGIHLHSQDAKSSLEGSVKVAANLSKVAGPHGIIVSDSAREHLTASLDAELEDLRTISPDETEAEAEAARGFRISPPAQNTPSVFDAGAGLWPTIAVIPFVTLGDELRYELLGEVVADEIIAGLSHNRDLKVISRLSTSAFRGRDIPLSRVRSLLGATYVLSGSCHLSGDKTRLTLELADARSGNVLWADRLMASLAELLSSDGVVDAVIARLCASIMHCEVARARMQPLGTLENSTLLIAAISLMHQLSRASIEKAQEMLDVVIERVPMHPLPHAWLAHLYSLRSNQGWIYDFNAESQLALDSSKRALDADPNCSLALAIDGYVQTHFMKRFDLALDSFERAVQVNPNDSLAWLLKSTMHSFKGEGDLAMQGAGLALRLSPLDPRRWYYDSLAATAALSAGLYDQAMDLARRSIRSNRTHTSSYRTLAVAQVFSGQVDDARQTTAQLMRLQPDLTVTQYRERHPAANFTTGTRWADALKQAGVPA